MAHLQLKWLKEIRAFGVPNVIRCFPDTLLRMAVENDLETNAGSHSRKGDAEDEN